MNSTSFLFALVIFAALFPAIIMASIQKTHLGQSTQQQQQQHAASGTDDLFDAFLRKFPRPYASSLAMVHDPSEFKFRHAVFSSNVERSKFLNAQQQQQEASGGEEVFSALTKYADRTPSEIKSKLLLPYSQELPPRAKYFPLLSDAEVSALPSSFNWVDHGAVTPVSDQGSAGTCWAFSTVENIEGQWFLKGNPLVALSGEFHNAQKKQKKGGGKKKTDFFFFGLRINS